ncbi:uncharacterized protein LOC123527074 isoform X2 [Mercenaria mercenaria]|nr:uncharacterized protein LOC123527074 isoform X2 [Mercenaria mercenaria]
MRHTIIMIKMIRTFLCFNCMIIYFHSTTAQLSQKETLKNITECDLNAGIRLTCARDEMIAIHTLQYAYNVSCEGICCHTYASNDCFVNAGDTDIQDIRRACSGRSSCNAPTPPDKIAFTTCSLGVNDISYIFLQYFCIPKERISSICSNGQTLTSDDAPLYLTNENYPSVTTGSASCSCSLEVYSCSSSINMYIMDADLYLDTSACYQTLEFLDGSNKTLYTIGCESHDSNQIESSTANNHYLKIDFINNSTSNQEGYFFIGLEASESGASFRLSCSYEEETWCVGCGDVPVIANGNIELSNVNDSSYEAAANVICDSGYETNTSTINCLANGTWPDPVCTEKAACTESQWRCTNGDCVLASQRCDNIPGCTDLSDEVNCDAPVCPEGLEFCPHDNGTDVCVDKAVGCNCGTVPSIPNGVIIIEDNSTIGSVANVTCNEGYIPSKQTVTCLTTGSWETVSCTAKACGTLPAISSGRYELVGSGTTFGASARVICSTGYTADKQSVICQSTGIWESAVCTLADCGTVPDVVHGIVTLNNDNNTTFAATASVVCEKGYQPAKVSITCQASGMWETPLCETTDNSTPSNGGSKDDKPTLSLVLIIVIVILCVLFLVSLVQFVVMCFLQCQIHNIRKTAAGEDSEISKRICMTVLGSVPVLGWIPIYITWKVFYRDVYQVNHRKQDKKDKGSKTAYSNNSYSDVSWSKNRMRSDEVNENEIRLEHQKTETNEKANSSHTEDNAGVQNQSSTMKAAPSIEHDG